MTFFHSMTTKTGGPLLLLEVWASKRAYMGAGRSVPAVLQALGDELFARYHYWGGVKL